MSTNKKKLYHANDIKLAQEEIKDNEKYFTKRSSKRKTVQIRISEKWHRKIKEIAEPNKIMFSFFLDKICTHFFKEYGE